MFILFLIFEELPYCFIFFFIQLLLILRGPNQVLSIPGCPPWAPPLFLLVYFAPHNLAGDHILAMLSGLAPPVLGIYPT